MKSMTGFGRATQTGETFSVAVEIKTVNNRFLDVNLRLPNDLAAYEAKLKRAINTRLARGRIDVNFSVERSSETVYELNRPLLTGYLDALKQLQSEFNLAGELDLSTVVRLPGIFQQTARETVDETMIAAVETALSEALDALEAMRSAEGAALRGELTERLGNITAQIAIIEPNAASVIEQYHERLTKKVGDLLARNSGERFELDAARLAQEVAYLAERSDISEELARLKSHLEQFSQMFNETGEVGKKLDFLTQELNREANTISSKATDMTVKTAALAIKAEIEKLREQVQNVE